MKISKKLIIEILAAVVLVAGGGTGSHFLLNGEEPIGELSILCAGPTQDGGIGLFIVEGAVVKLYPKTKIIPANFVGPSDPNMVIYEPNAP